MSPLRQPQVVAVVGSPRRRGNTALLVDEALAELEAHGIACTKLHLGELAVAPCRGHEGCAGYERCTIADDGPAVLEHVYEADGLLLATPVYYEDVSAQMKAFIDRNYFPYNKGAKLQPQIAGLLVVTAETGLDEAFGTLRRYLALSSDDDIPTLTLGGYADELGAAAQDEELLSRARALGADMAAALLSAAR